MRIERIAVYTANLEYTGKAYAFAGGRSHQVFETTVVALSTDTGLEGYGEVCPCGPNYMAAFAEGLPAYHYWHLRYLARTPGTYQ